MKTLTVPLDNRSYPIYIGNDILSKSTLFNPHITGKQVLVVTNQTIAPLYLEQCQSALADFQCEAVILPDGEQYKTLDTLNLVFDALLTHRFDRSCTLVALGGGVIGDITGFAAASYQRGVHFIQVPTTLLSQVDSSVGGKTGVNHALGKNMIGAFYQPRCVIADINTLNTLEDNQLSAGLAEVIKYGLISDSEFFTWLESHVDDLRHRHADALIYAIEQSCQNKSDVVAADELEAGQRALLNLGHTFGHAIENAMGYGQWLHGEAVATGMSMAADLSFRHHWLSQDEVNKIDALLIQSGLPVRAPQDMTPTAFLDLMSVDKKVKGGVINLILLDAIGKAKLTHEYDHKLLLETLKLHPARINP